MVKKELSAMIIWSHIYSDDSDIPALMIVIHPKRWYDQFEMITPACFISHNIGTKLHGILSSESHCCYLKVSMMLRLVNPMVKFIQAMWSL